MKKYIACCLLIFFTIFMNSAIAKTLDDFISEGLTKKDLEKGFIEVSTSFLKANVPKGFDRSELCTPSCIQMEWEQYCSGAILTNTETNMMIMTLDRCGYPDGQNRKYPPTEAIINLFLTIFDTGVLPKNPGLTKREDYLPQDAL